MEELQKRHRQEQKDLQSRVMQKKKSATKRTRKGVNDECANLEGELREQQELELSAMNGSPETEVVNIENDHEQNSEECTPNAEDLNEPRKNLHFPAAAATTDQVKKPNRQKVRLARRAAEQEAAVTEAAKEASDLPDLREQERKAIRTACTSLGLKEKEIRSDGHCLYAAVADQLFDSKIGLKPRVDVDIVDTGHETSSPGYKVTRQVAANYISRNPNDFVPFLEEPLDEYIKKVRDTGEWGGHLELLALARAYVVNIKVLQGDGKVETIECGSEKTTDALWLAYYRHYFGLGEHYNSLGRTSPEN